ncbi:MAG TPA: Hsp70 family protein, partial [Nitrosopumilaceae archaeon]
DQKKKEAIDIKNEAESFIYTTEKLINHDLKDKISQEKGIKITDAIRELKEVLNKDAEQIKTKLDTLKSLVNEITTELYKNVTPPPGAGQQTDGEQKSESTSEQGTTKDTSTN